MLIDVHGNFQSRQCADKTLHAPCMFEHTFIWPARIRLMDGMSVYETRVKMGEFLADKIKHTLPHLEDRCGDPDSRLQPSVGHGAGCAPGYLPYREGFVKNRYIGRTFIMPGQATRKKSVRQKLNAIAQEFKGKNVLLVDDSIVRGTTSREIVLMAREAGAHRMCIWPRPRHRCVMPMSMASTCLRVTN